VEDLYRQFWLAWQKSSRYYRDARTYPSGDLGEARRLNWAVRRMAQRIEQTERARVGMPPASTPDVPGQMLLTDMGVHMMPVRAKEVA
jgi:hypothetical protein